MLVLIKSRVASCIIFRPEQAKKKKKKVVITNKEGHYIKIKGSIIQQEIAVLITTYHSTNAASIFMRQKLMELHKEIDEFTILVEGFNTPLLEMYRSSKEKISKDLVKLLWFECLFFPNPPNSNVEILIPKVMIFGGGPLGGV